MKNRIYSILASATLLLASCSEPIIEDSVAPNSGKFSVVTNLDVVSRASTLASDIEFYLYIDQATDDYFVKMKNVAGAWIAYSVETPTEEVELTIYGNVDNVVVSALCCGESLSIDDFTTTREYAIDSQKEIYYATNGENTMGAISISEDGVISIEFGMLLSRLDITLSGDESSAATIEVSGLFDIIEWCALTNEPFSLSSSESSFYAAEGEDSTYSCYIAPQSVSSFKIDVTTSSAESKMYMISGAEFTAGESHDLTLRL